jgi:hypothetical protein
LEVKPWQPIEWHTDDSGRVVMPSPMGDCELTGLQMSFRHLELTLFDPGSQTTHGEQLDREKYYRITCKGASYLKFDSDHLQNVIEDVWILTDRAKAEEFTTFSGRKLFPTALSLQAEYYIFITPITGVELFAVARSIQFYSA